MLKAIDPLPDYESPTNAIEMSLIAIHDQAYADHVVLTGNLVRLADAFYKRDMPQDAKVLLTCLIMYNHRTLKRTNKDIEEFHKNVVAYSNATITEYNEILRREAE